MIAMMVVGLVLWQVAPAPVDFSGTYEASPAASKALTESKGLPYRVAGAGGGIPTPEQMAAVRVPVTVITQSPATLTFETRSGASITRTTHKLDGSESVNSTSFSSTRSRAKWTGRSLVVTGTTSMEINGGDLVETAFVSTYTRMPNGDIHVETRSTREGLPERVTWNVLVRRSS